jgi:hypothetical protein
MVRQAVLILKVKEVIEFPAEAQAPQPDHDVHDEARCEPSGA